MRPKTLGEIQPRGPREVRYRNDGSKTFLRYGRKLSYGRTRITDANENKTIPIATRFTTTERVHVRCRQRMKNNGVTQTRRS